MELETTDTCGPLSCERNVPDHHETNIIQLVIELVIELTIYNYNTTSDNDRANIFKIVNHVGF